MYVKPAHGDLLGSSSSSCWGPKVEGWRQYGGETQTETQRVLRLSLNLYCSQSLFVCFFFGIDYIMSWSIQGNVK